MDKNFFICCWEDMNNMIINRAQKVAFTHKKALPVQNDFFNMFLCYTKALIYISLSYSKIWD